MSVLQRFILDHRVVRLTEVDATTVPLASRLAADRALAHASNDLDLPSVLIRWYRPARSGEPIYLRRAGGVPEGVVNGDRPAEIGILEGLPPVKVADVVLHEAFHVRQFLDGRDGHSAECQREAEIYAGNLVRAGVARAIGETAEDDAARAGPDS